MIGGTKISRRRAGQEPELRFLIQVARREINGRIAAIATEDGDISGVYAVTYQEFDYPSDMRQVRLIVARSVAATV